MIQQLSILCIHFLHQRYICSYVATHTCLHVDEIQATQSVRSVRARQVCLDRWISHNIPAYYIALLCHVRYFLWECTVLRTRAGHGGVRQHHITHNMVAVAASQMPIAVFREIWIWSKHPGLLPDH